MADVEPDKLPVPEEGAAAQGANLPEAVPDGQAPAEVKPKLPQTETALTVEGFNRLPMSKQIGLMVGFAALVALAVAVVLWSQEPSYRMLYGSLADEEILEIGNVLDQAGIPYQLNQNTNSILVEADTLYEARLKLASAGLPKGSGSGYEILDQEQGFGTSQFMETARYHRALEGELSKTISSLNAIKSARVHLAIPKQSSFVRDRKHPSASVVVSLFQGRFLSKEQAASITHMVASSIANMEAEDVTVVDQSGRLLSRPDVGQEMQYNATQFEFREKLEQYYTKRIETILTPILGVGKVRAQVVTELDFTMTEQTQEAYSPDIPAVRSEQSIEEQSEGRSGVEGVPGSLSNQPPQNATAVEIDQQGGVANSDSRSNRNSSRRMVRNYELDRTISHTKMPSGTINRLSVAVVVDDKADVGPQGEATTRPLSDEEMQRITGLVKEAVGFNASRGDSVNVINAAFLPPPEPDFLPEPSLLEQPWVWDALKQIMGMVVILALIFVVVRPVLKGLAAEAKPPEPEEKEEGEEDQFVLNDQGQPIRRLIGNTEHEQQVNLARQIATEDPRRVADIIRVWVAKDGA